MSKIKDCSTCQNDILSKTDKNAQHKCDNCLTVKYRERSLFLTQYEPFEFKVGDYVETTNSDVGYISSICHCEECERREFYEPEVVYKDCTDYISCEEAKNGFKGYKRIGKYDFTEPKQSEQSEVKKIDKLSYPSDWVEIRDKINEVIDRVNEIGEK